MSPEIDLKIFKAFPSPSLIIMVDAPLFTIKHINDAFIECTGINESDLLLKSYIRVFESERFNIANNEILRLEEVLNDVLKTGERRKNNFQLINGTFWKIQFTPIMDVQNTIEHILITIIQLVENKIAVQNWEFSQPFQSLFENNPDGIFSFDLEGNFLTANQALLDLAECTYDELITKNFQPFIAPEDVDRVNNHFRKAAKGEVQNYDVCAITSKDNHKTLNITNFPISINEKIVGVYGIAKDITVEKLLEGELKGKSEELQSIFDNSLHAVFITEPHMHFLDANEAAIQMFGYSLHDLREITINQIFDPDDSRLEKLLNERDNRGKTKGELTGIRKNGEKFPIELSSSVYINSLGERRAVTSISNITSWKKAEETLRKNEKLFKTLVENSQDIISLTDKDGKLVYVNPSMERITGYKLSEIAGSHVFDLVHPNFPDTVRLGLENLYENPGVPMHRIHCFQHKDGHPIWLEGTVTNYLNDEDIQAFVSNYHDITVRKNIEEQLRKSNKQLIAAQQIARIGYWSKDLRTDTDFWSDELYKILGLEVNEIPPSRDAFFTFIHPEDLKVMEDGIKEFLNNPHPKKTEVRFIQKSGKTVNAVLTTDIQKDIHGITVFMEGTVQDVTDQKQNELLLEGLNDMLKLRAEELMAVNEELEKFAYVASHDLKEPLRMITGFLDLLQSKYSTSLDETARTYINYAVDGSKRMQQLITALLNYSRLGRETGVEEVVDLNILVQEVQLNLKHQMEENNARVIIQKPLPTLKIHRISIERLFQNLIANAIKFKKASESPIIEIDVKEKKYEWKFRIKDNGIGLSKENYKVIFEIFKRLHVREEYSGTGMGLAICRKIVQQNNGKIWVESELGKGSVFYFTLGK